MEQWSEAALTLLDTLWSLDTHMWVTRKRLHPLLGFYPTAQQVREVANRYKESPAKVAQAAPSPAVAPVVERAPNPLNSYHSVLRPRMDNPVGYVPSGTHAARGFSILGGRIR